MKKLKIICLIFLIGTPIHGSQSFLFNNQNKFRNAANINKLTILENPYIIKYTLGDQLVLDGLLIEQETNGIRTMIDDYTINGFDNTNLGTQSIEVYYDGLNTSFEIYFTNDGVSSTLLSTNDLFISEIVFVNGQHAIEIYNHTESAIELNNYSIAQSNNSGSESIALGAGVIESSETIIINENSNNLDLSDTDKIELLKNNSVIDVFNTSENNLEFFNGSCSTSNNTFKRHYRIHQGNSSYNPKEWINVKSDLSDLGKHAIQNNIVSIRNQARAFARYVMYGAGMFAAGRVNEAFTALKIEFELMEENAKTYFIENKNEEVQGVNEEGKQDVATFREAHGRISVLASQSGNSSFIPPSNNLYLNFGENSVLFIICGVGLLLVLGYVVVRVKSKKKNI